MRMQLAGAMAWMTSVIALVIGAIGTLNTMLTSVLERTKEIGILRAIGWPKGRVVRMILLESCSLTLLACLIGTLLAFGSTWALSQAPAAKGILNRVLAAHVYKDTVAKGLIQEGVFALLQALSRFEHESRPGESLTLCQDQYSTSTGILFSGASKGNWN